MTFYGTKGEYQCGNTPIGEGAEGMIYSAPGGKAVKVFHQQDYLAEARTRIEHMLRIRPTVMCYEDGTPMFSWPEDIVYSDVGRKQFAGYVMHRYDRKFQPFLTALIPKDRKAFFGQDSFWLCSALAYNCVELTRALETGGYSLSDLNPGGNILVDPEGHVVMIDVDSLCFTENTKRFTPKVSTIEYLPPELQHYTKTKASAFGAEADRFMVAVMIFNVLFWNNHPFMRGHWNGNPKHTGQLIADNIAYGDGKWAVPAPGWPDLRSLLPATTFSLLQRVFGYTHAELQKDPAAVIRRRPSLEEWHAELARLLEIEP